MRMTGHTSRAVFDAYADHLDENALMEVGNTIINGIGKLIDDCKQS